MNDVRFFFVRHIDDDAIIRIVFSLATLISNASANIGGLLHFEFHLDSAEIEVDLQHFAEQLTSGTNSLLARFGHPEGISIETKLEKLQIHNHQGIATLEFKRVRNPLHVPD